MLISDFFIWFLGFEKISRLCLADFLKCIYSVEKIRNWICESAYYVILIYLKDVFNNLFFLWRVKGVKGDFTTFLFWKTPGKIKPTESLQD